MGAEDGGTTPTKLSANGMPIGGQSDGHDASLARTNPGKAGVYLFDFNLI